MAELPLNLVLQTSLPFFKWSCKYKRDTKIYRAQNDVCKRLSSIKQKFVVSICCLLSIVFLVKKIK